MTKWKIYNEDAVEWAKNYQKAKFHALLCDAPYHLTNSNRKVPPPHNPNSPFSRHRMGVNGDSKAKRGFMGQEWDGGDLAFRPETWEAFGEVLHPGAFGMAFSASRNWHRMAVAIEDAGFILHPTIFLWSYGQGFPKATNISKQLHKQGNEDGAWEGHRYGLQALKPAVEPIIVFQKPYEGRPLDNIVETGAGALNIEGARIPVNGENVIINRFTDGAKPWGNGAGHEYDTESTQQGRWPANLILDGSAERLDAQTGKLSNSTTTPRNRNKGMGDTWNSENSGLRENPTDLGGYGDNGGASRFFYNVSQQLDESDPVYYCGKVSPRERNAGLEEYEEVERRTMGTGMVGVSGDRLSGKGTPIEMGVTKTRNPHPTLKPIDLCRYLAMLLLPPEEYAPRRIFIPFSGVASEMIGAGLAGWEHIVGVEFDTENDYVDIAEKRLQHWLKEQK